MPEPCFPSVPFVLHLLRELGVSADEHSAYLKLALLPRDEGSQFVRAIQKLSAPHAKELQTRWRDSSGRFALWQAPGLATLARGDFKSWYQGKPKLPYSKQYSNLHASAKKKMGNRVLGATFREERVDLSIAIDVDRVAHHGDVEVDDYETKRFRARFCDFNGSNVCLLAEGEHAKKVAVTAMLWGTGIDLSTHNRKSFAQYLIGKPISDLGLRRICNGTTIYDTGFGTIDNVGNNSSVKIQASMSGYSKNPLDTSNSYVSSQSQNDAISRSLVFLVTHPTDGFLEHVEVRFGMAGPAVTVRFPTRTSVLGQKYVIEYVLMHAK